MPLVRFNIYKKGQISLIFILVSLLMKSANAIGYFLYHDFNQLFLSVNKEEKLQHLKKQ